MLGIHYSLTMDGHSFPASNEISYFSLFTYCITPIVWNSYSILMPLRIFFKQLIRMSTGHSEGDLEPLFVLLTDQAIYLLRRGERLHRYITETRIVFNDLDYISVSTGLFVCIRNAI